MSFGATTPQCHHTFPTCGVCGCDEVDVDYVEEAMLGASYALELGECPRCDHRWTRPLRMATRREAQRVATVNLLRQPAIPNAA